MRTLVHLSDLHFGRVDADLLTPLAQTVARLAPDVVVVSGDLTQRARTHEFRAAGEFLGRLPAPRVVVPGNHDVPLYNLLRRVLTPLAGFREHIEPDLGPRFVDAELAVVGVNTARALVVKNGRINAAQMAALQAAFRPLDPEVFKVVVTHHPFDLPPGVAAGERIGRADQAMQVFAQCGVDLLLAGHLHVSHGGGTGDRYALAGYEALAVSAGTATSTRGRGEVNSFNTLRVEKRRIELERFEWNEAGRDFTGTGRRVFVRADGGWRRDEAAGG